ncbi:MAG: hypothetical protein ACRDP6_12805 [Actinoallomurus sp.]
MEYALTDLGHSLLEPIVRAVGRGARR